MILQTSLGSPDLLIWASSLFCLIQLRISQSSLSLLKNQVFVPMNHHFVCILLAFISMSVIAYHTPHLHLPSHFFFVVVLGSCSGQQNPGYSFLPHLLGICWLVLMSMPSLFPTTPLLSYFSYKIILSYAFMLWTPVHNIPLGIICNDGLVVMSCFNLCLHCYGNISPPTLRDDSAGYSNLV